jgi:hypothetical protein
MTPSKVKLTRHGQGDLGARDWGKEGDGLYASARHLWASSIVKARKFEKLEESGDIRSIRRALPHYSIVNSAFPKASTLLIGYCIEMYLKGGMTKLLIGCADDVFRSELRRYSHDLEKLAKILIAELDPTQLTDLKSLSQLVLNDARYPVEANDNADYVKKYNARASMIYNGASFRRYCRLAKYIRSRIVRIDNDSSDPCSTSHWKVDENGYLCYRYGGHLPPRITYRRCTSHAHTGAVTLSEVEELITATGIILPGPDSAYQIFSDQAKGDQINRRLLKRLSE